MLQLLHPEHEVLVVLARGQPAPLEPLLHGGVHQRPCARRPLPSPAHNVLDDRPSLLALDAPLLDQTLDDSLHPVPRRRRGPNLQENQPLQRLPYCPAHSNLPFRLHHPHDTPRRQTVREVARRSRKVASVDYEIATAWGLGSGGARGALDAVGAPGLVE
jgi:hypothetical protein